MTNEIKPDEVPVAEQFEHIQTKAKVKFLNGAIAAGFTAPQAEFLASLKKEMNGNMLFGGDIFGF